MRNKYLTALALVLVAALTSCEKFNDANDAEKISAITLNVKVGISNIDNLASMNSLVIKFNNSKEGYYIEKQFDGENTEIDNVIPGIYSVTISGNAKDTDGNEYYINGNLINQALYTDNQTLNISLGGLKVSPLVFKEIYYSGSRTPTNGSYFRDQFYEIYNNSGEVQYLDGIYFANLTPGKSTNILPVWPESDGGNYAYAERVWKFPGTGTDYPLEPGESCVISQFAVNHKLDQYNPNSPVDASSSEFEFNMNNVNYPDQPAYNMVHVFYQGKSEIGRVPQYLTSVFGGAYVIFKVPEGDTYDPVNDPNLKTTDLSKVNSSIYFAKIPVKYVLDAVECIDNETKTDSKRVPAVLDAGMTWVGASYNALGVARKQALDSDGNILRRENGAFIFQDTNNSTDDFERGVTPQFRRYDAGMPSWNHTLKTNL